jgi:hypothetical protein
VLIATVNRAPKPAIKPATLMDCIFCFNIIVSLFK